MLDPPRMVQPMVTLTRMTGAQFALNPDLIERVDCTPDTVISLVDGTKYIVLESLDEVVAAVRDYRAQVIGAASAFERSPEDLTPRNRLSAVPDVDSVADGGAEDDGPVRPIAPRSL